MKKTILIALISFLTISGFAQDIDTDKGSFMINAGLDIYRVPRAKFFEGNINPGLDFDYFVGDKFAVTLGLNYSSGLRTTHIEPGLRFYPVGGLFIRTRAALPINLNSVDVSAGLGYDFMMNDTFAVEANIDRYINWKSTVFRLGIALFL